MNLASRLSLDKAPVFLMDGTAFIYRSFYANRHLRRSDGFPTNALTLVTRVLLRILKQEIPEYFLFVMDGGGYNLRKDIYAAYKANREAMPEDLSLQIEPIKEIVSALGLQLKVITGHEADDCISALAAKFSHDRPVIIVSGDKDLKQCLKSNVFMWDPASREEKLITEADFIREEGITPAQWPDMQALIGDSSDDIPGVPGIGPKTARQIFQQCENLEAIRDHLDLLPEKIQIKLRPHLSEMFIWRKLTTLNCDACATMNIDELKVTSPDLTLCKEITQEFELNAVYKEIALLFDGAPTHEEARKNTSLLATPGLPEAPHAQSARELPPIRNNDVALVWPHGPGTPPRIAVASPDVAKISEYEWLGKMADLCDTLGEANRIIVPDYKELLTRSPSFRQMATANPDAKIVDLALASWLLDPEDEDFSWPKLATQWGPELAGPRTGPAALALILGNRLMQRLADTRLLPLYMTLELPLAPVLAHMQERGFAIDPASFSHFLDDVQAKIDELTAAIFSLAGERFNLRSSQKLGEILYGKLGLPDMAKTKTGLPSTSQATLEKLAPSNPIVDLILEFRKLDKMRSTYLDPLPRYMDAQNRIHSTFNQEATATGRISSSDPNLQNIPVKGPLGKRMRACFIAGPDNLLVAADYSQIELRILAHLSADANLIEAFKHNEDIHARTASLIFDIPRERLEPDQRRMAKTINFGLLYGMGSRKLAQELKISPSQAKDFIDKYFGKLKGLKEFYARILASAHENGFVETMAGRRRWLPGIHSANGQTLAQAERQAVNTVIQGSAADIMKLAMLRVDNDPELSRMGARLVLQVHDELLLETPKETAKEAGSRIAELMKCAIPGSKELKIPLVVDWGIGENWAEAH